MSISSVAVLGAGSFGTAMAKLLGGKVGSILMVGRDAEVAAVINATHRNPQYLSEVELPENIVAGTDVAAAAGYELVIFAVPTAATRDCANELAAAGLSKEVILLSCAKGIEKCSGERMSEILRSVFPENPLAVISGPNHAEEVATGLATCAVIGSEDEDLAHRLQVLFSLKQFRTYTTNDLAGIELGGAIKNVYAIAAGIAHGLGLGDNAVAALVTRALAEMTRLGTALGGRVETFAGLSGVGDLVVTCFSEHSRNHRVGVALGQGKSLDEATRTLGMVAEGVPNTLSIHQAARKAEVRTPIIDAVYAILYNEKPAQDALFELLSRDPRSEHE